MLCVISGGNWDNGSNAGAWALNLNSVRGNSNSNVGLRADSMPATPQAAMAVRQRGSHRRGLCRNVLRARLLVAALARVGHLTAKTGVRHLGGAVA